MHSWWNNRLLFPAVLAGAATLHAGGGEWIRPSHPDGPLIWGRTDGIVFGLLSPPKLTQYWRIPAHDIQPDLRVKVNVRRTYWASQNEVPGGPAFENFELRQRYAAGQIYIFGLTPASPWDFDPKIPRLADKPN